MVVVDVDAVVVGGVLMTTTGSEIELMLTALGCKQKPLVLVKVWRDRRPFNCTNKSTFQLVVLGQAPFQMVCLNLYSESMCLAFFLKDLV